MAVTKKSRIQAFVKEFGRGLTEGDGAAVAGMFQLPAYVVGDSMAMPLTEARQVEAFFGSAPAQYRKMGIKEARPEIDKIEPLTEKLFSVDVRWPYLYEDGHRTAGEASRYVVEVDDDQVRIRTVTMLGTLGA